jgi:glyoxylate/hydroxypyruvate reductase A
MAILMMSKYTEHYVDPEKWRDALTRSIPDLDFRVWPDVGDYESIEMVLADFAPPGLLRQLPNLKLISYLGYGVDALFEDPELPKTVPMTRIGGPGIAAQVTQYVILYLLRHHRLVSTYERQQARAIWQPIEPFDSREVHVGVLGLGRIGGYAARSLASLDFRVLGWSRTAKDIPGVRCFHGTDSLASVLERSDYVVCVLPLTRATRNIINAETIAAVKRGAYLINVGRGGQIVERDLLDALEAGYLSGAALDVFEVEPLPADSPFWAHPKVTITPHVAAFSVDDGVAEAAENYRRIRAGRPFDNLVDPELEY